jgi:signal transduction histidine kinase/ActR/RegA family two-component response regulator/HAMP domain-containing protein
MRHKEVPDMSWFQHLPIRRKLTVVILLTCTAVLLAASVALGTYDLYDFRRSMVRNTTALADILGKNTRAALAFQDEAAARETLMALQSEPHVVAATLYTSDGSRFADYIRSGASPSFPVQPDRDGHRFDDDHLAVFHPIALNEKRIGTIHLQVDLLGIRERLGLFSGIAGLVLFGSLLMALALSSWLQRPISRPILALAETAQAIAERKDYSVRAAAQGKNEFGVLTNAFNDMLSGIQERETALRTANDALHEEVAERRLAEGKVQAQLARLAQLHQITRATGERQDLKSIFQVVIRSLEDHLPVDFCCICLYEPTNNTLTVTSVGIRSETLASALAMTERSPIPIDQNGLSRCVRGYLVYEPDITHVKFAFPQRLVRGGLHSLVVAPLLVESKVFGVLVSARRQANSFSSGECEFLKQLSEHVALAAHQAQLYTALQQAYDDLRQTQQAVMQQERLRALGQMASGIAHDINNAISPVTLYTESLLETEPALSPRARDYLTTIQRSMDDVTQTVSRMREFYRQREPQLALLPVNLNNLVTQVLDLTRVRWTDMAQENGISIDQRTELAPTLPAIFGVEGEIREALTNLIFNAVDAMPQGGTLTIRTRLAEEPRPSANSPGAPARLAAVEIVDTGIGMDDDTRRRCLEPFFTTKGERGTGLGLAMVYGTVQRHNAEIEIDSAPGKGTCMRLLFPVPASVAATTGLATITPASVPSRMRLLIVDDDPLIIKSLRDILEGDGHEVITANGGQEGMDTFREAHKAGKPFATVITDLGMPYVDGRKVAATVKTLSPTTSVIMLTGWGQRMASEGDIPPHVDRVLSKPPKLRDLRAAFAGLAMSKNQTPTSPAAS